jgi:hypothetical protein
MSKNGTSDGTWATAIFFLPYSETGPEPDFGLASGLKGRR